MEADVVKLVDTLVLGTSALSREGSSPFIRTNSKKSPVMQGRKLHARWGIFSLECEPQSRSANLLHSKSWQSCLPRLYDYQVKNSMRSVEGFV